jgi:hypothetical protein
MKETYNYPLTEEQQAKISEKLNEIVDNSSFNFVLEILAQAASRTAGELMRESTSNVDQATDYEELSEKIDDVIEELKGKEQDYM